MGGGLKPGRNVGGVAQRGEASLVGRTDFDALVKFDGGHFTVLPDVAVA